MSKRITNIEQSKISIIELYELHTQNITGNKKYRFKNSEKRDVQIDKFSKFLIDNVKIVTVGYINQYLVFAFGKYVGRKGYYGGKNCFTFSWIISVKLLKEFIKHDSKVIWKNERHLKEKVVIKRVIKTRKDFKNEIVQKIKFMKNVSFFEEQEKRKFFNTIKGYYWCIDFTTLYNNNSDICSECKFKERCISLLKANYTNLYKTRFS